MLRVYSIQYDIKKVSKVRSVFDLGVSLLIYKNELEAHDYLKSIGCERIAASRCYESEDFSAFIQVHIINFEVHLPKFHLN